MSYSSTIIHEKGIFENERFSPLSGWSSKGLLIADRKAFSTRDGLCSWTKIEEAEDALASLGWVWSGEWTVDTNFPNTDDDGWQYAVNFGSFESASSVKSMVHFVRRRRKIRSMSFKDTNFFGGSCDYCDSEMRDKISEKLLNALILASISDGVRVTEPKANQIKNKILESAGLPETEDKMPIDMLLVKLENFSNAPKGFWKQASSRVSHAFTSTVTANKEEEDLLSANSLDCGNIYFQDDERRAIASILIRKHDSKFEYHCSKLNCGALSPTCVYTPTKCINEGCTEVISLKWIPKHDNECPYKIIDCRRACGDTYPRRHTEQHLVHACPLRPVFCPFRDIGCDTTELTSRALPAHMDACAQGHILLLLTRLGEQQNVIVALNARVNQLEEDSRSHATAINTANTAIEATVREILIAEKRTLGTVREELVSNDKKFTKLTYTLQTDINNIRTSISQLSAAQAAQSATVKQLTKK